MQKASGNVRFHLSRLLKDGQTRIKRLCLSLVLSLALDLSLCCLLCLSLVLSLAHDLSHVSCFVSMSLVSYFVSMSFVSYFVSMSLTLSHDLSQCLLLRDLYCRSPSLSCVVIGSLCFGVRFETVTANTTCDLQTCVCFNCVYAFRNFAVGASPKSGKKGEDSWL